MEIEQYLKRGMHTLEFGSRLAATFEKAGCKHIAIEEEYKLIKGTTSVRHVPIVDRWYSWVPIGAFDVVVIGGPKEAAWRSRALKSLIGNPLVIVLDVQRGTPRMICLELARRGYTVDEIETETEFGREITAVCSVQ